MSCCMISDWVTAAVCCLELLDNRDVLSEETPMRRLVVLVSPVEGCFVVRFQAHLLWILYLAFDFEAEFVYCLT